MATDNSAEILGTLRELLDTMKTGSIAGSGFYGDPKKTHKQTLNENNKDPLKASADRQRIITAMKEGTKALKDTFKDQKKYSDDIKIAGAAFQNAVQKLSLKSFDELPNRINALTKKYEFNFQTKADIDRALNLHTEENIKRFKQLADSLLNTRNMEEQLLVQKELEKMAGKNWTEEIKKSMEQLKEEGQALGKAINIETIAIEDAAKRTSYMGIAAKIAEGALLLLGKNAINATKAAAKFGVEIKPLTYQANLLGMSIEDLAQLQNQNLQGIRSSGISLTDFDNKLIKSAWSLAEFTGSLPDGAKLAAGLFQNFRMLSNQTTQYDAFMEQSSVIFKEMHDTVGLTTDQFIALNQSIQSNSDIQVNMYRLNQRGRIQAMLQLQSQDAELRNMGLLDDEAKNVIATFAQIGAQGPKERLKQAAQLQAVGGALGMGKQAAQLAAYIRSGDTQNPEAIKLAQQLQKGAQSQYANVKGTAGEFAQYALTNLPGVQQILGQSGPVSALAMRAGMQTPAAARMAAEAHATGVYPKGTEPTWTAKARDDLMKAVVGIDDTIKGVFGRGLVDIVASVAGILFTGGLLKKMLGKGISTTGKAITLGEGAGAIGEGVGVAGAGLAGAAGATLGIGAAAAGGYALGSAIDMIPKLFGSQKNFSDMIGGKIADHFLGANEPSTYRNYSKDPQIAGLMEHIKADQSSGNKTDADKLTILVNDLVKDMAIADKRDPTKAVEDLHRTLKQQHQENKQMTQEQTDAIQHKQELKVIRTSNPIGPTS